MKAKTELFLYHLLWSAESLARPTFRNLSESFEGWAYRNGLLRQIAILEKMQLVERKRGAPTDDRIYRLTENGRQRAFGGRDPLAQWARRWDGRWRVVLFDIPMTRNADRQRLRRYLHGRNFGYLQNSVWITPDPLDAQVRAMRSARRDVETFILLEATAHAGESSHEIVAGAWDFDRINKRYQRYLEVLRQRPRSNGKRKSYADEIKNWSKAEWNAWRDAVLIDPLLPRRLLPKHYLGEIAFRSRVKASPEIRKSFEAVLTNL